MEQSYEFPSKFAPISILLTCCSQLTKCYKIATKFCAKFEPVSRFLIDPISITYMLQSSLLLENCYKFLCKHKNFFTDVYIIFKYQ